MNLSGSQERTVATCNDLTPTSLEMIDEVNSKMIQLTFNLTGEFVRFTLVNHFYHHFGSF